MAITMIEGAVVAKLARTHHVEEFQRDLRPILGFALRHSQGSYRLQYSGAGIRPTLRQTRETIRLSFFRSSQRGGMLLTNSFLSHSAIFTDEARIKCPGGFLAVNFL